MRNVIDISQRVGIFLPPSWEMMSVVVVVVPLML